MIFSANAHSDVESDQSTNSRDGGRWRTQANAHSSVDSDQDRDESVGAASDESVGDDRGESADDNSGYSTLWQGRFEGLTADTLRALNDSLPFDRRMFREDIEGSRAHATMLASVGLITDSERNDILAALDTVETNLAAELAAGCFEPETGDEDIHTVVERLVTEITPAGAKLHTGRSRNDQVATDLRLWTKKALTEVAGLVVELQQVLCDQAEETKQVFLPGYTHLQQAQPVTLAHHLLAHGWALSRDIDRLFEAYSRTDVSPLGAGALAGSSLPLDAQRTADRLGFAAVLDNSIDAVSDRDFVADALYAFTVLSVHLSRIGEEMVLWSTSEFAFVEFDDRYTTGSSMMPQKKNPDIAELARAKTGRVIGDLTALLVAMKGLPLAYSKDMQEAQEPLFDAFDTICLILRAFTGMIATVRFNVEQMSAAASSPYSCSTDLAEWLVLRGVPFRRAHAVVAELVRKSLDAALEAGHDAKTCFVELVAQDSMLGPEAAELLMPGVSAGRRTTHGAAGASTLDTQLERFKLRIETVSSRLRTSSQRPSSS